jgi:hypothetical protein
MGKKYKESGKHFQWRLEKLSHAEEWDYREGEDDSSQNHRKQEIREISFLFANEKNKNVVLLPRV